MGVPNHAPLQPPFNPTWRVSGTHCHSPSAKVQQSSDGAEETYQDSRQKLLIHRKFREGWNKINLIETVENYVMWYDDNTFIYSKSCLDKYIVSSENVWLPQKWYNSLERSMHQTRMPCLKPCAGPCWRNRPRSRKQLRRSRSPQPLIPRNPPPKKVGAKTIRSDQIFGTSVYCFVTLAIHMDVFHLYPGVKYCEIYGCWFQQSFAMETRSWSEEWSRFKVWFL